MLHQRREVSVVFRRSILTSSDESSTDNRYHKKEFFIFVINRQTSITKNEACQGINGVFDSMKKDGIIAHSLQPQFGCTSDSWTYVNLDTMKMQFRPTRKITVMLYIKPNTNTLFTILLLLSPLVLCCIVLYLILSPMEPPNPTKKVFKPFVLFL